MPVATAEELDQAMEEAVADGHVEPRDEEQPKRRRKKEPEAEVEEPTEVSTASVDTVDTPAQEDETPEFLQRVAEVGFRDVDTVEAGQSRLLDAYRELREQKEELDRKYREAETFAAYGKQYLSQREEPKTQTDDSPKHWWSPPAADLEEARRYLVETDEGREWKPDTPPELRAKVEAHVAYVQSFQHRLLERPQEVLPQIIEHEFDRLFEERYGSRVKEREAQDFWGGVWEQEGDWAFRVDPLTNRPDQNRMSPAGEYFYDRASQLVQSGLSHEEAYRYAKRDAQDRFGELGRRKETTATPTDEHEQRKEEVRKRALRGAESIPDRRGSFAGADENRRQNDNLSFGQEALRELKAEGML